MTEAAKEARRAWRREYQKKWRRANPEKQKEYSERYWERKAAEMEGQGDHREEEKV